MAGVSVPDHWVSGWLNNCGKWPGRVLRRGSRRMIAVVGLGVSQMGIPASGFQSRNGTQVPRSFGFWAMFSAGFGGRVRCQVKFL